MDRSIRIDSYDRHNSRTLITYIGVLILFLHTDVSVHRGVMIEGCYQFQYTKATTKELEIFFITMMSSDR